MVGNVIYPIAPANNGNSGIGQTASTSNTDGYTVRTANMVKLTTDKFAGFEGTAFYTLNNANTDQTATSGTNSTGGGSTNNSGWGVGVNYTWNKLLVTANYQALKS